MEAQVSRPKSEIERRLVEHPEGASLHAGTQRRSAHSPEGQQRLSLRRLRAWETLKYGMFLTFGMSTFDGDEVSKGDKTSSFFRPDKLDVDQWISVARDAGMRYAVLVAKHTAGHCLWPSRHTAYHVGTSGNKTDVVEAFVTACRKRGLLPGLYYCAWDNRHRFGSLTPTFANPKTGAPFTTQAYEEFQSAQIEELLTQYGEIGEVWIDIPAVLTRDFRNRHYTRIAELQPRAVIVMNQGLGNGSVLNVDKVWPTDVIEIERHVPYSLTGYQKWREVNGKKYYLPGEVCDTIGREWFCINNDQPRPDAELLGMYLITITRGANLLLNVPPDQHGLIPKRYIGVLTRLRKNLERLHL